MKRKRLSFLVLLASLLALFLVATPSFSGNVLFTYFFENRTLVPNNYSLEIITGTSSPRYQGSGGGSCWRSTWNGASGGKNVIKNGEKSGLYSAQLERICSSNHQEPAHLSFLVNLVDTNTSEKGKLGMITLDVYKGS